MWVYICRPIGDVAQLVEQRIENPCVGGSIPSITTTRSLLDSWEAFFIPTLPQIPFDRAKENHASTPQPNEDSKNT